MRKSNQLQPNFESIDMHQWRQDIDTFVDEMHGELEQIIDGLSITFSPVDGFGFIDVPHTSTPQNPLLGNRPGNSDSQ